MKCLIIGGAGFIGSYVSRILAETGRDVFVLGRRSTPRHNLHSKVVYRTGDFNNRELLKSLLVNVNEIIDLAYSTVPKTSFEDPLYDIFSNLPPGVGLLQEATKINLRKMVYVSSGGTVYGKTDSLPINETHPNNPISPYGITKLAMEKYVGMFHLAYGLPTAIARPSNAYGEEQAAFTGQGFIATAIRAITQGKTIDIYGKNGTIRDYLHVSDVAQGIVSVLDYGTSGQAYNIGSGIGKSNIEVLDTILPLASKSGFDIKINTLPERAFDVPENILNSNKLFLISGWQPKISFEEGTRKVWNASITKAEASV